ncbi:MAG: ABC transporter permease subunit [Limimaricola sp.]|uniref:amino acid ABC transporter permease n=1 Tax=Limimaricola sp. TaxID=2211665 RepID=UPI001E10BA7B|nr:amino acid ABC transporter permease [Limimaricola sp.]MBI1415621.1 ABC transporter permease subunit [Limimaricola sp.]
MAEAASHTTSYVRDKMLPQAEPPTLQKGAIKWMRDNLFSGWLNSILTIVSIYVIWAVVSDLFPWFANSIWRADSLTQCREIRNATVGADAPAACFAVIVDRWQQLLFGFYPREFYWRPILSLVVMLTALMPVLFPRLPRAALLWSVSAPFVIFFLLWGGSVWFPLAAALGFVIGAVAWRLVSAASGALLGVLAAIILPIIYWLYFAAPLADGLAGSVPLGLEAVPSKQFGGFMLSVVIGISGIVLSLPLGILLALGRQSPLFIINKLSVGFIEIIRGVPLIVWLFTASLLLNYFLPPGTNFDLMLRVIIMVTLFASAYIAEVVRGGLAALPKGQYEAADALGLDYWKSMRLIILPQALKIAIPGIVNTFIGLFKDTTLVVFIGLLDPIGLTNAIRASTDWNGIYWELFLFIALMFFVFCFSMGRYSLYLEKKLRREHR